MNKQLPDQDTLKRLLDYDQETGRLVWKSRPREMFSSDRTRNAWNKRFAGVKAFTSVNPDGYRYGTINGNTYRAHRIIFTIMTGQVPDQVDHISGNRSDNRWNNLRDVSQVENSRNMRRSPKNTSGITGVHLNKRLNKFQSYIRDDGKLQHLGLFDTMEAAIAARKAAELVLGYHPNHGRAA
jgi:type II secretory pathway component PulK